jgi:hypothetical protein
MVSVKPKNENSILKKKDLVEHLIRELRPEFRTNQISNSRLKLTIKDVVSINYDGYKKKTETLTDIEYYCYSRIKEDIED